MRRAIRESALDLRRAARHANDDARARAEELGIEHFLDELLQHLLGHREIGDDPVFHRTNGGDIARRAAEHLLRREPDFLDHALAVRAAFLPDRHDRGLVEHDALAAHVDERIGCSKIDREIAREIALERFEHGSFSAAQAETASALASMQEWRPNNRNMIT